MSGKPKHVCFYSKRKIEGGDSPSLIFLEELSKTPFTNEFQFVCVDACGKCQSCASRRPAMCSAKAKLPSWLKCVPTLLIDGESDPRIDDDVFNWLSMRKIQSSGAPARRNNTFNEPPPQQVSSRGESQYAPPVYDSAPPPRAGKLPEPVQTRTSPNQASKEFTNPSSEIEPEALSAEISGGNRWSDPYSFIDDQFSIEKGTGGSRFERNFSLLDAADVEPPKPTKESEKAKALNSALDNYRKQREADMPKPVFRT